LHQFSPLQIIQSYADLAFHSRNLPQSPFAKGAGGISGGPFQKVRAYFFQKTKLLQIIDTAIIDT
jgi:hypothetical protein